MKVILSLVLALFLTALIGSEGSGQQVSPSSAKTEKVRIAYPSRGITVLPLRIALVKGFFSDERIEPEIIQMGVPVTIVALANGNIDYGAPTDSILRAAAFGQPFKKILSFVNRPMHYLVSRGDIASISELKGKTFAINAFSSTPHVTTTAALRAHGVDPKDMRIVALGESPARLAALKQGLIDACVVLIPDVIIARKMGFKVLAHAGGFIELSTPGLAVTDKHLKERPDQVKRVVRAAVRGLMFLRQNREESIRIMMEWLVLDREIAAEAYDMALTSFSEDGRPSEKGMATSVQIEKERRGIKEDIPLSKVADIRILHEVLKEMRR